MSKYKQPKLAINSPEDAKRVAEHLSQFFSEDKVLVTKEGNRVRGKKSKLK